MQPGPVSQEPPKEKVQVRLDQEKPVAAYLEARHRDVKTIKEALAKGDYGFIREIAREIQEHSAEYGFHAIGRISADLAAGADARDDLALQEAVHALHLYLERLEIQHV